MTPIQIAMIKEALGSRHNVSPDILLQVVITLEQKIAEVKGFELAFSVMKRSYEDMKQQRDQLQLALRAASLYSKEEIKYIGE